MNRMLKELKSEARSIASRLPSPAFYARCDMEIGYSREMFFDHPLILRLQEDVLPFLYDDYGHGIDHSKKVAVEAGAIVLVEAARTCPDSARHLALLAQIAGLLHDICRLEPSHATRGAEMSRVILLEYPLADRDKDMIASAIASHEAFTPQAPTDDPREELLAGALYDADKFRWGPDNFSTTLWEICDYEEWPMDEIVRRFPEGLKNIGAVALTFRTLTGQSYGPELIDMGLGIGRELYRKLLEQSGEPGPGDSATSPCG